MIILKYIKPLEQVDELVSAHIEFLKRCYEQSEFICSGRRNPRVGGVILANVGSEKKVWELINQDPFFIEGIAEYEVIEFLPSLCDGRFACFVEKFGFYQNYAEKK